MGAVYEQTLKGPFGRSVPGDYCLVETVINFRIKVRSYCRSSPPDRGFDIEPTATGSRVKFSLSYQPRGLKRLLKL